MTDHDSGSEPSLIQQRLALQRRRVFAIVPLALWGFAFALAIFNLAMGSPNWWILVAGAGFVIYGLVLLRRSRRDIQAFEAHHGADAGIQH